MHIIGYKMKKFRFYLSLFLISCLCGCFFNYEVYNFTKVQKKFAWGNVGVTAHGTEYLSGCTGNIKQPYELGILFWTDKFQSGTIYIENINVFSQKTKHHFLIQNNLKKNITKEVNFNSALFRFPNLNLPFENIEVHINFRFKIGSKSTQHNVILLMEPKYKKHPIMFGT